MRVELYCYTTTSKTLYYCKNDHSYIPILYNVKSDKMFSVGSVRKTT